MNVYTLLPSWRKVDNSIRQNKFDMVYSHYDISFYWKKCICNEND